MGLVPWAQGGAETFQKGPQQPPTPTPIHCSRFCCRWSPWYQMPGHWAEGPWAQDTAGLHLSIFVLTGLIHSFLLPRKNCSITEAHLYWPHPGENHPPDPRGKRRGSWHGLTLTLRQPVPSPGTAAHSLPPPPSETPSGGGSSIPLCSRRAGLPPTSDLGEEGQLTLKVCFRLMLSEGCTAATRKLRSGMLPRMLSSFSSVRKQRHRRDVCAHVCACRGRKEESISPIR